jgi:Domain of unknown function (DUF4365)
MSNLRRKRRTRSHVIADLSVNHVERHALMAGFVVERIVHDYGIDLELLTFTADGEVEEGKILMQLKASDRMTIRTDRKTFPFRLERRDLVQWLAQPMPVILVIYDAAKERAFWLYLQDYFRKRSRFSLFTAGKTATVRIPTMNVVNVSAMGSFRRFRDNVLMQMRELIHGDE